MPTPTRHPQADYCCHSRGFISKVHCRTREMETGKLFYIIPRHNRANLSVSACTYTFAILCFFKVQIGNISQDFPEYRFHGGKKLPLVSGFSCAAISAVSCNYNNELWRSNGTQTPREISIMSSKHEIQQRGAGVLFCPCEIWWLNITPVMMHAWILLQVVSQQHTNTLFYITRSMHGTQMRRQTYKHGRW